jgi:hypothetical protein
MSINLISLRQSLTYANNAPSATLLSDIQQLAEVDHSSEIEKRRFQNRRNLWAAVAVISGLLAFVNFGLTLIVAIPATIVAIQAHNRVKYYSVLDLPNYRYRLAQRLTQVLQRDLDPNESIGMNLGFSPLGERNKFIRQILHPYRSGWHIDCYSDRWLTLKGRLQDNTKFLLTITQTYQFRSGRNRNNNLRFKPRMKGFDILLKLTYPAQRYSSLKNLRASVLEAIKLPQGVVIKDLKVSDRDLRLKIDIPPHAIAQFAKAPVIDRMHITTSTEMAAKYQLQTELNRISSTVEELLFQTITLLFLSVYQMLNLVWLQTQQQSR